MTNGGQPIFWEPSQIIRKSRVVIPHPNLNLGKDLKGQSAKKTKFVAHLSEVKSLNLFKQRIHWEI
jgi:hypothetical protein